MKLVRYPDPLLNQVSIDCTQDDLPFITECVSPMKKVMEENNGIGLSAVQVGVLKRFCLINDNVIINPVIIETEGTKKVNEGCLSLPYFQETIARPEHVMITFRDLNWEPRTATLDGLEAQCIMHEIEHMNGQLLYNQVSLMKQEMWKKRLHKKTKYL